MIDLIGQEIIDAFLSNIWQIGAFYTLAAVIVIAGLLVVLMKNIVHSVLWLAVCFIGMAGLFLTLDADFLAAVQLLVYAGAVCIMIVLAIMVIRRADMKFTNPFNTQVYAALGVVLLVLAVCTFLAARTQWFVSRAAVPENTVEPIATLMLSKYVIPFEVVAVLLLVALVGALLIAREVKTDAGSDSRQAN
jgi:NADH-quinone oxidoreductase subunit J